MLDKYLNRQQDKDEFTTPMSRGEILRLSILENAMCIRRKTYFINNAYTGHFIWLSENMNIHTT